MAESYFSIITATDAFGMDATVDISRSLDSKVTEFPVEDGGFASDNIVNMGDSISMRGIISDVNSLRDPDKTSTSSFIAEIERIRNAKELVSVNVGLAYITGNIENPVPIYKTIEDCAITSVTFSQNQEHGISRSGKSSYQVSIRFKKVRIIDRPTISVKTVSIPYKDSVVEVPPTPEDKTTKKKPLISDNLQSIL
jgi:hypothetical protein